MVAGAWEKTGGFAVVMGIRVGWGSGSLSLYRTRPLAARAMRFERGVALASGTTP